MSTGLNKTNKQSYINLRETYHINENHFPDFIRIAWKNLAQS